VLPTTRNPTRTRPTGAIWLLLLLATCACPLAADIEVMPAGKEREKEARRADRKADEASERRLRDSEKVRLTPPPIPVEAGVEVVEGGTVEIPLRAASAGLVEFVIRSAPTQGELLEIRPTGEQSAVAVYRHRKGRSGPDQDAFLYAARAPGGAISAPVRVGIRIQRPDPRIEVLAPSEFGRVRIGTKASRSLTLRNTGGGVAEGTLQTSPPWSLSGDRFRLAAGETAEFLVWLAPSEELTYLGSITILSTPPVATPIPLRGQGFAPFTARIDPESLSLPRPVLALENRLETPLEIRVTAPDTLELDPRILLPPGAQLAVPLRKRAGLVAGIEGEIQIQGHGSSLSLPFRISPDPARIEPLPERLQLGDLEPGATATREFRLRNAGGVEAEVRIDPPADFTIERRNVRIPPGNSVPVPITLTPSRPGPLRETIRLTTDGSEIRLPVEGNVATGRSQTTAPRSPGPAAAGSGPGIAPPPEPSPAGLPLRVEITGRGKTWFSIRWQNTDPSHQFRIEGRKLSIDTGERRLNEEWLEAPGVTLGEEGKFRTARIDGLRPGRAHTLRVIGTAPDGTRTVTTAPLTVTTEPSWRPRVRAIHLLLGLAVLLGALAVYGRLRPRRTVPA